MSLDPNPNAGAVALAGMLCRLEALREHLQGEVDASGTEFHRLRALRPSNIEEFSKLVDAAREECITIGLQTADYSTTLDRVGELYRDMVNCAADPTAGA